MREVARRPPFTSWAQTMCNDVSFMNSEYVHQQQRDHYPHANLRFIMNGHDAPTSDMPFHVLRGQQHNYCRSFSQLGKPAWWSHNSREESQRSDRHATVPTSFEPTFCNGPLLRKESLNEHNQTAMTAGVDIPQRSRSQSLPPVRRCVSPPMSASGVRAVPSSRQETLRPVRPPTQPAPVVPWCVGKAWGSGRPVLPPPAPRLGPFVARRINEGLAANINRNRRFT